MNKAIKITLGLFLFLLPWQTIWIYKEVFLLGEKFEYATLGFYATELLLWVVIILFFISYFQKVKKRGKIIFSWTNDRKFIGALSLFCVYAVLSSLWSVDSSVAQQSALRFVEACLLFLVILLGPLSSINVMQFFVGGALVQSIFGLWQFITQSTFSSTILGITKHPAWQSGTSVVANDEIGRLLRAYGSFPHPNIFGGFMVVALFFLFLLLFQKKQKINYIISHFVYIIILAGLIYSFSRSAMLSGTFFIVVLAVMLKRKKVAKRIITFTILFTGIFVAVSAPLFAIRMQADTVHETRSLTERASQYEVAKEIIIKNPILGVGAGNYTLALKERTPDLPGWGYQPVHNAVLLFIAEFGIVGVLLLIHILVRMRTAMDVPWIFFGILLILALFDHYLLSSYVGLMLLVVFTSTVTRHYPRFVHSSSTGY